MEARFVLDDRGDPVPESNLEAWTRWFERADRSVSRTNVAPDVTVVTTFRGIAETDEAGTPIDLYQTRVMGGPLDGEERRHRTRTEAVDHHARLAEWCRIAMLPNYGITGDQIR